MQIFGMRIVKTFLVLLLMSLATSLTSIAKADEAPQLESTIQVAPTKIGPLESMMSAMRRAKLGELSTEVFVTVDEIGNVQEAILPATTGHESLDKQIIKWARKCKFPAGKPGSTWLPLLLVDPN